MGMQQFPRNVKTGAFTLPASGASTIQRVQGGPLENEDFQHVLYLANLDLTDSIFVKIEDPRVVAEGGAGTVTAIHAGHIHLQPGEERRVPCFMPQLISAISSGSNTPQLRWMVARD